MSGTLGCQLASLEFLTMSQESEPFYALLRGWKMDGARRPEEGILGWAHSEASTLVAAMLSAYLEAHAPRLLAPEVTVTVVPTTRPVVVNALRVAAEHGWVSVTVTPTGQPSGRSQRLGNRQTRLAKRPQDWSLLGDVAGPVLLLDDLYTTGASMHSYAGALRAAGAACVRGVALARVIRGTAYAEHLRHLRTNRTHEPWRWRADRKVVRTLA